MSYIVAGVFPETPAATPEETIERVVYLITWAEESKQAQRTSRSERAFREQDPVWDQGTYAMRNGAGCASAHCQAGSAAVLAGYRMVFPRNAIAADVCVKGIEKDIAVYEPLSQPGAQRIHVVAQHWLGLTPMEAEYHFESDRDIEGLKVSANTIADNRDLPLPYPDLGCYDD